MGHEEIFITDNKKEERFLRKKTVKFDFKEWKKKDIDDLLSRMKRIMREADGIGLSANQIGLPWRLFVAEVPGEHGKKFYAVFNPKITKKSTETELLEEGCLSIPGTYGTVKRHAKVVLQGFDKKGKPLKIKAWGLLAHVFQHETDHLDGALFIDKTKSISKLPISERLKKKTRHTT